MTKFALTCAYEVRLLRSLKGMKPFITKTIKWCNPIIIVSKIFLYLQNCEFQLHISYKRGFESQKLWINTGRSSLRKIF